MQSLPHRQKALAQWVSSLAAVPVFTLGAVLTPWQIAVAGSCGPASPSVCAGPASAADDPQFIDDAAPISMVTQAGFGLSVGVIDNGIDLRGAGGVSFVDDHQSNISTAGMFGLYVRNDGSGDLTITSTGFVKGSSLMGEGIRGDSFGENMLINANDTQGENNGLGANGYGSGTVRVVSKGTATGLNGAGIYAYMVSGTDLTIEANNTQGYSNGIVATGGAGVLTVISTGLASASNGTGIQLYGRGTGITVTAADSHGGAGSGIAVHNDGTGPLHIVSTGSATGSVDGIAAQITGGSGTALTITVNDAQGGRNGVYTTNSSGAGTAANTTTINVLGHVAGGSGAGIASASTAAGMSIIDLSPSALVEAASGTAISNNGGDSHVIVRDGAIVNGAVRLGAGNDTLDLLAGFSGTTVLDGGGAGVDTLNVYKAAGASRAGGDIRNWSAINLDNSELTLTDAGLTAGASSDLTSGVFLRNGSTLSLQQDGFVLGANLSLSAGTALLASTAGIGNTTISGTVTNAGTISMGSTGAGSVLTIAGNYVANNGVIALKTVLGDDNSVTDRVVIQGDTSGSSVLKVSNAGGAGAATKEGIVLVSVGGASNGTFVLSGDYDFNGKPAVVAGAYAYQLYKGNASGTETDNWYLRSELRERPAAASPQPIYQAGVPTYEAYPQALLGLNGVATLQRRVGNRHWGETPGAGGSFTEGTGAWARIEGGNSHLQFADSSSNTGLRQNVSRIQAGSDFDLLKRDDGKLIGGAYLQYVHGSTVTRSSYGNGDISTDGYGLGGTLTWYGNQGFYIDGQAQFMRYSSDLNSRLASRQLVKDNKGSGYTLSVESGKRIPLSGAWSLTPQAQLSYSRVDFDSFHDVFDARVRFDKGASLQSRLGVTLDHEALDEPGSASRSHIYGIANLYYEFLNGSRVNVAGVNVSSRPDRLWGGVGAGTSYNWNKDKYSLYAEALVNTSLANPGSSRTFEGNVGFRMRW